MDSYLLWSIGLLMLGVALLAVEFFVPSAGVISVLSILAFLGALFFAFREGPVAGLVILVLEGVAVPTFLYAAIKFWPHSPIGRLILAPPPEHQDDVLPINEAYHRRDHIGKIGVAKTDLLPAGAIELDGRKYEATAQGPAIDAKTPVRVVAVQGNRLVVRATDQSNVPHADSSDADYILSQPLDDFEIDPFDE